MSTPNFAYAHRCVMVTDEDYENGNYPSLSEEGSTKPFGSAHFCKEVLNDGEFRFFVIVMTVGYFADACIDYVEKGEFFDYGEDKHETFSEFQYLDDEYKQTKGGLYKYLTEVCRFNIRKWQFNKIVAGKDLEDACYAVLDYLKDEEEKDVNRTIDQIRDEYGFIEVRCKGVFSNGEAVYERVVA